MAARIATAIFGIPIVVYAVCAANPWALKALLAVLAVLGLFEFARLSGGRNWWVWLISAAFVTALALWHPAQPSSYWILALLAVPALDVLTKDLPRPIVALGWIALPLLSAVSLRAPSLPEAQSWGLSFEGNALLLLFLCLWAGDSMAYFVGKAIGKHKIAPSISPNKTWEGAIANLIACAAVGWFASEPLALPPMFGLQLGIACGILGQLGDLYQSAWKRRHDAKDSGGLLPGHGGVLDRFDSLLFCLPAANAFAYVWL